MVVDCFVRERGLDDVIHFVTMHCLARHMCWLDSGVVACCGLNLSILGW